MGLKAIGEVPCCADEEEVDLIGVVVESGLLKTTRGTGNFPSLLSRLFTFFELLKNGSFWVIFVDCFCLVRIVDDSLPSGIGIHFYIENMEHLPVVQTVGDILFLTSVVVNDSLSLSLSVK